MLNKIKIDPLKRNIIIACGITIFMLALGIYSLLNVNKITDESFDNGNATHVCILSAQVISTENTGYGELAKQTNFMSDAKKSWLKYNCKSILLTDNFGNTCFGTTGFRFNGVNQDGIGMFTCANIVKQLGVTKT